MLKARIRVMMCDITRDEEGMKDITMLLEEIRLYIDKRYDNHQTHHSIINEHDGIIYQLKGNETGEVILQKGIMFVASKADHLTHDPELLAYYQQTLTNTIASILNSPSRSQQGISSTSIQNNLYLISTFLPDTMTHWLDYVVTYLNTHTMSSLQQFARLMADPTPLASCQETTKKDLPLLIEE
jgi:hypothetical protein